MCNAPLFLKGVRRARHQRLELERRLLASRSLLLHAASRLQLDVLSSGVGEQVLPDAAAAGLAPHEDLAAELVLGGVAVPHAELPVGIPDAEEAVVAVDDVPAHGIEVAVVRITRAVHALMVERPRMRRAVVVDLVRARIEHHRIAACGDGGGGPLVARTGLAAAVVPGHSRGKEVLVRPEQHLDLPERAGDELIAAEEVARRPVLVLADKPIDRRGRPRRVSGQAEVELDAARAPRTAHRDVAKLHRVVRIDEVAPRLEVLRAPHLAADRGNRRHFDQAVRELHGIPGLRTRHGALSVIAEIRIQPRLHRRHRIRISVRISRQRHFLQTDRYLAQGFHTRTNHAGS